jgi:SAM-dependent methyltransferase
MPRADSFGPSTAVDGGRHWFEDLADHMGAAYLRYSFTLGTAQEVAFLVDELGLVGSSRVLDLGCGPGRHAIAFAERGMTVVGVDISETFVDIANDSAPPGAHFLRGDARRLADGPLAEAPAVTDAANGGAANGGDDVHREAGPGFDAVISLCQGGFGLCGPQPGTELHDPQLLLPDLDVLRGIRWSLRRGGRFALSAFSAYFQLRFLEDGDTFDARTGVNHESTEVMDSTGRAVAADLWTTCYTPRELRLLVERAGLVVDAIYSVTPGAYARNEPSPDSPEFLVVGTAP